MPHPGRELLEARTAQGDVLSKYRTVRYGRQDRLLDVGLFDADHDVAYFLAASDQTLSEDKTHVDWIDELHSRHTVPVPGYGSTTSYEPYSRGVENIRGVGDGIVPERHMYLHDSGVAEAIIHQISDSQRLNTIPLSTIKDNVKPYLEHVRDALEGAGIVDQEVYASITFYNPDAFDLLDLKEIEEDPVSSPVVTLEDVDEAAEAMTASMRRAAKDYF